MESDTFGADYVTDETLCCNMGMSLIQANNIARKVDKALTDMVNELEEVFREYCDREMVCVGVFSNGEAVYGDVTSERNRIKAAIVEEEATWGVTAGGSVIVTPEKVMATV